MHLDIIAPELECFLTWGQFAKSKVFRLRDKRVTLDQQVAIIIQIFKSYSYERVTFPLRTFHD